MPLQPWKKLLDSEAKLQQNEQVRRNKEERVLKMPLEIPQNMQRPTAKKNTHTHKSTSKLIG